MRPVDVEAAAAAAVEDIKQEEWELDAIEKRKEQQVCLCGCRGMPFVVGRWAMWWEEWPCGGKVGHV
jgi:hypothetical protein